MIARDGSQISLWQDSMNEYRSTGNVNNNVIPGRYDVAIVGGGITGITMGLLLQQAGKKCILLEAHSIGFGTTGGTTAHLNTLLDTPYTTISKNFGKDEARLVAQAAREAIQLIQRNIRQLGIDCGFEETPGYLFAQNDDQDKELNAIHDACLEAGVDVEFAGNIPIPQQFTSALLIHAQAKFHPLEYVQAIASAFEKAGGVIIQQCRVLKSRDHNPVEIETTHGHLQASALVYATHIPPGINILHARCAPYRSYAMAVKLNDNNYPESLAYDMYEPYHYYRTQVVNGERYLIAGGEDHRSGEEINTESCFLKLENHIRTHFDVASIAYRWSSQYFESVDGLPYIGLLPGADNIYTATGFGGNGMIYSHVSAALLRDLIIQQESPFRELFNPKRVKPIAGFTEFISHNIHVIKQFAGKWFPAEELQELAALAPGEGKVVSYEDQTLALYKDEHGSLYAVNPTCVHMKCSVHWNSAEKSWDCPCHGARYAYTGEMLTGPASDDLEVIELRSLAGEHHE
jgi:glycine/D-amino acid oxidase-like deaminating enzyme/nitrite reductase/ring-hydroxylating ferredoxin subunit